MAYRRALFANAAPGKGRMTHSLWPFLVGLMVLFAAYQFSSGYLHARFGKASERSVLAGEWVGVAQLQPADGPHQPPSYDHGSGTIKLVFKPATFSYLSNLSAEGEITDSTGRPKKFVTGKFLTPFEPTQGHFSVRTLGGESDDALTGTITCRFDRDTLTVSKFQVSDMFVTAILHPGTEQDYKDQIEVLRNAPRSDSNRESHGK